MKKILIVALAVFTLTAQSCKKKSNEPEPPSAKELLTQDDWLWTELIEMDNAGNVLSQSNPNRKFVLTPSGDYFFYDATGDISAYGTWQLLNDDSQIRFMEHSGGYDLTHDILKLEQNEFIMLLEQFGQKYQYTFER